MSHGRNTASGNSAAEGVSGLPALASGAAAGLVAPGIVLAWLMAQIGAPGLAGLIVPVAGAAALLPAFFGPRPSGRRRAAAAFGLAGIATLGIAVSALVLWGPAGGAAILALLALAAFATSTAGHRALSPLATDARHTGTAFLAALAPLGLGAALAFGLGPRGALVIWALMAAGALWLLAAVLHAATGWPVPPVDTAAHGDDARVPHLPFRLAPVAAALALPFLVLHVSENPGRGLAALGGLLLAATLAGIGARACGHRLTRRRQAGIAILAAAGLALVTVADPAASPAHLSWLLFPVVFATTLAARSGAGQDDTARPALLVAFLAGSLLAPLAGLIGPDSILLLLALLLATGAGAALRQTPDWT